MPIDLNFDDDDERFAATVDRFCQEHVDPVPSSMASDGSMDRAVWTALALGSLGAEFEISEPARIARDGSTNGRVASVVRDAP